MRTGVKLTGLGFVVALGGLLWLAACGQHRGAQPGRAQSAAAGLPANNTRPLTPLPTRPLTPSLQRARDHAMQTAAATRELAWQHAPGMIELSGWEYGTRTRELAETLGGDELRRLSRLAVAGGMLPAGTDLATLAASFAAASAGATYSPLDKQVLLLADPGHKEPVGDSLLAHEFVHALQDQHFDLLHLLVAPPYDFDRAEALFAVIEGDAMSVQRRLEQGDAFTRRPLATLARAEDARFADYRRGLGAFFPPLLTETFIFRYRDGLRFVEAVRRTGGARAVDELFRRPPASSEQVLHPEKYFADEQPRGVGGIEAAFLAHGYTLAATTPLGEIGVRGLLLKALPVSVATRAAAGWGGDRAYLFERSEGAPLFVWQTVWDKPADAAEFFAAYNMLQAKGGAQLADPAAGAAELHWRSGAQLTLVRHTGLQVAIISGAAADVNAARTFLHD